MIKLNNDLKGLYTKIALEVIMKQKGGRDFQIVLLRLLLPGNNHDLSSI